MASRSVWDPHLSQDLNTTCGQEWSYSTLCAAELMGLSSFQKPWNPPRYASGPDLASEILCFIIQGSTLFLLWEAELVLGRTSIEGTMTGHTCNMAVTDNNTFLEGICQWSCLFAAEFALSRKNQPRSSEIDQVVARFVLPCTNRYSCIFMFTLPSWTILETEHKCQVT